MLETAQFRSRPKSVHFVKSEKCVPFPSTSLRAGDSPSGSLMAGPLLPAEGGGTSVPDYGFPQNLLHFPKLLLHQLLRLGFQVQPLRTRAALSGFLSFTQ